MRRVRQRIVNDRVADLRGLELRFCTFVGVVVDDDGLRRIGPKGSPEYFNKFGFLMCWSKLSVGPILKVTFWLFK